MQTFKTIRKNACWNCFGRGLVPIERYSNYVKQCPHCKGAGVINMETPDQCTRQWRGELDRLREKWSINLDDRP